MKTRNWGIRVKRRRLLDLAVFLLCMLITDGIFFFFFDDPIVFPLVWIGLQLIPMAFASGSIAGFFGVLLMALLICSIAAVISFIFTFPILLIYRGFRAAAKRNMKMRTTFTVESGIEYFRDPVKTWSPGVLDLNASLSIHQDSSFAATLLDMEQRGWISIYEDGILLRTGEEALPDNEAQLMRAMAKSDSISFGMIRQWEESVKQEAIRHGLIRFNKDKKTLLIRFIICVVLCVVGWILSSNPLVDESVMDQALAAFESDPAVQEIMARGDSPATFAAAMALPASHQVLMAMSGYLLSVVAGFVMFLSPVVFIGFLIGHLVRRPKYVRTRKGNALMEESAALHRFIHDFSTLEESQREALKLWGPFLVYAVAFGENESIAKDLGKFSNMKIRNSIK